MSVSLRLPAPAGVVRTITLDEPPKWPTGGALRSRSVYAAAHVVADPLADNAPGAPAVVDWDATLAFRRHLWSLGLGVADAMDTAQRGAGLDWPAVQELIRRSGKEAAAVGGRLVCGAGTDQLTGPARDLDEVRAAYEEQLALVEDVGSRVVLMCSRELAALARSAEDYHAVYAPLLRQSRDPVILHWLGPMFDPALTGYWGSTDLDVAIASLLTLIADHRDKIDGIKLSLLDSDREIALRRALPDGVRLYTGDDYHYPQLMAGDQHGHSDALLGIFDPIAPAASAAVRALDDGDPARFRKILDPTVPLARHLFGPPTYHYKTGVVFLAWLAGHQDHPLMVGGAQAGRSVPHLVELVALAAAAHILPDPELAADRMRRFLAIAGFGP
ncbi:MAG TPA: dihydrodipicolinate synthase family protein [Mycobacteriales bacterium]